MSDHSLNANRGVYHGGTAASATTTDSGILRKLPQQHHNVATEKSFDDLLIFGYACKIFRDDEKARYIDQGKHLIPWMGDNSLKIDRLIFQAFFVLFFFGYQRKLFRNNHRYKLYCN